MGLLPGMEARPRASGGYTYRWKAHGSTEWVNLGTDRDEAIKHVANASGKIAGHGTMRWLWEQWSTKSPRFSRLSPGTQADYAVAWKQIDKAMGTAMARAITSTVVARYVHVHRADTPRRANIEKSVLSGMFKYGILLGCNSTNPTIGVESHPNEPSVVLPETAAIASFAKWLERQTPQRRLLALAMRFVAMEGSRQCEFLPTTWLQVDDRAGTIRLIRAKQRGKKREQVVELVEITPRMRALLDEIKALGRDVPYLFPTDEGNAYTASGFKNLFQRCIRAAIEAGVVRPEARFNFHSLRRYYTTMHKAEHGSLPDLHANPAVTAGIYDGTKIVKRKALNR